MNSMKRISHAELRQLAEQHGYDQVIVIARKVGVLPDAHGEYVISYGSTEENRDLAAKQAEALKHYMGWPSDRLSEEKVAVFAGVPGVRALDGVPADATHVVSCISPGCDKKIRISTQWMIAMCESCITKLEKKRDV